MKQEHKDVIIKVLNMIETNYADMIEDQDFVMYDIYHELKALTEL